MTLQTDQIDLHAGETPSVLLLEMDRLQPHFLLPHEAAEIAETAEMTEMVEISKWKKEEEKAVKFHPAIPLPINIVSPCVSPSSSLGEHLSPSSFLGEHQCPPSPSLPRLQLLQVTQVIVLIW